MASSSISLPRTWNVFTSFHGPDVRHTFLGHLRKQFTNHGISMFDDEKIERGESIDPALTRAIWGSKISIVLLSKNYASSSWCLDELLEIMKCRKKNGQIVKPIFYGVDPSDVADQTGDFGRVFDNMCVEKTEKERKEWSQALEDVAVIAGNHLKKGDDEAEVIEKIAKDILDKLNVTPSRDFDDMVGLKAHLKKMESLLDLDYGGVKVVAISGTAGIGKSTIARALQSHLSDKFSLTCYVDNLRESYSKGLDEYGAKKYLQEQLLSKLLDYNGIRIRHLGAIQENLCDQKVLIILDDVNHLMQLEALAGDISWFGPGSRIVVTTQNKELLQQHGINNTYHVELPSDYEAFRILCSYAFKQSDPHDGFKNVAKRVTELCGNLPLGLRVVGSSLCGKKENEWEDVVNRLETILHRDIEDVLRVGYERLDENEQMLFLHIAIFCNNEDDAIVEDMLASNLEVKCGIRILIDRSLIKISTHGKSTEMHTLLRKMARKVIHEQKPSKRQILTRARDICEVLENKTGTSVVSGISFNISGINELIVNKKAFKRMFNLQFLRVYKSRYDDNNIMHLPEEMEFPRFLRLLDWQSYPSKCLPPTFHPENLVKLCMRNSQLEYLWQGPKKLTNLKKLDLSRSFHLKELPDFSYATNLERLEMAHCKSLIEIPSSFSHLQKLEYLQMNDCINLQVIPHHLNLASLKHVDMKRCSNLPSFSFIWNNLSDVGTSYSEIEDVPPSIRLCSDLQSRSVMKSGNLPTNLWWLDLSYSGIERIPDCFGGLHGLQMLFLTGCRRLASLPELPASLGLVNVDGCESLETIFCPLNHRSDAILIFTNCFKLNQQAREEIIQRSFSCFMATLPGREVPEKFDHQGRGNLLVILPEDNDPLSASSRLKLCVVISPIHQTNKFNDALLSRRVLNNDFDSSTEAFNLGSEEAFNLGIVSEYQSEHIFMFHPRLPFIDLEADDLGIACDIFGQMIAYQFSSIYDSFAISGCGAHIWTDET